MPLGELLATDPRFSKTVCQNPFLDGVRPFTWEATRSTHIATFAVRDVLDDLPQQHCICSLILVIAQFEDSWKILVQGRPCGTQRTAAQFRISLPVLADALLAPSKTCSKAPG